MLGSFCSLVILIILITLISRRFFFFSYIFFSFGNQAQEETQQEVASISWGLSEPCQRPLVADAPLFISVCFVICIYSETSVIDHRHTPSTPLYRSFYLPKLSRMQYHNLIKWTG